MAEYLPSADSPVPVPTDNQSREVATCNISVDGQAMAAEVRAQLTQVEIELDVDLFGSCTLTFNDPKLALINGSLFASGVAIGVRLGRGAKLSQVFQGEVVALEPRFSRDRPPSLRVCCLETLHRLALSQMTRALNDVDEGQIATRIAQEHGLTAEAPSGTRQHALQGNVTDAAYLRRMAAAQGKTLRIEGKKLIIGPPPSGGAITVSVPGPLKKARVRIDARRQVNGISVHAWDTKTKQEIVGSAAGEGEIGEGARKYGGSSKLSLAGHDVSAPDVATAEKIAKGRLRKVAEGFVTASLELIGDERLVVGAMVSLEKLGSHMEGTYRVDHAVHRWSRLGYSVACEAVRVSAKTAAARNGAQAGQKQQTAVPKEAPPPDELRAGVTGSAAPVLVEVAIAAAPEIASVDASATASPDQQQVYASAAAEPDLHHLDASIRPA